MGKKYVIYKHTFPNGKVYIGITSQNNIKARWGANGAKYQEQPLMFSAILKYGWINIKHEILEKELEQEEAYSKETYYISLYKSTDYNFGYNISKGASEYPKEFKLVRNKLSEDKKIAKYKKASESMKLAWKDPEVRERITKGIKNAITPEYREKLSKSIKSACANPDTKAKKSAAMKKRYENNEYHNFVKQHLTAVNKARCRKVICEDTGVIYNSVREASELSGVSYGKIRHSLSNNVKNPTTHWRYL